MRKKFQHGTFYNIVKPDPADKVGEVRIYGYIPDVDWEEYTVKNTVDQFVRDFRALEKTCDRINIRINSGGGSLFEGLAMFNAIAASPKDTHTYNDGIAFSLGALLLVAGKTVHAAKNSMTMIHNGSSMCMGHARDMREMADSLEAFDLQICGMFADKTGKTVEEIQAQYLNYKDNFLTAKQAHEAGFVDVIEDYKAEVPENITAMNRQEILNYFRSLQGEPEESFFNRVLDRVRHSIGNFLPQYTILNKEENMDFPKLQAALAAADEKGLQLSPAQVQNLKEEVAAAQELVPKAALEDVKNQLLSASVAKAAAEEKADGLEKELAAVKAEYDAFKKSDGGTVTVTKAGTDEFGDAGESVQDILDALPHNRAIADHPLFN